MIIYENTKLGFCNDVDGGIIARKIEAQFEANNKHHNNDAEYRSWLNSLMFMRNVLNDDEIPSDVSLAVEYQIPLTSKRVDFLIAGKDQDDKPNSRSEERSLLIWAGECVRALFA